MGKAEEIKEIFKVLNENGIRKETIENCLSILARGKAKEIEEIFKVLNENSIQKEIIENCLSVLAMGKAEEIKEIFKVLNENSIQKEIIENCLTVLAMGKAEEIKEIFKVLNENIIQKEIIENCLTVLAMGKAEEIKEIFKVLNENRIQKEIIENCLSVLAMGKAEEIKEIFKVLNENGIQKETIEKCLSVLARGKAEEIKEIFKVLNENGIQKEIIENCLTVLARGKAEEIKEIFKVLNENGIQKETIENCLTVLAMGKAEEIKEIFKVLNKNGIQKETIENCLSVLARGKAEEIKEIFKVLNENGIEKTKIEENYGWILVKKDIEDIFSHNSNYVKEYMKLKGLFDRVITKDEISYLCEYKKISINEFFINIDMGTWGEPLKQSLEIKGGIYVGKSIPIDTKKLEKYGEIILDLAKKISRNFCYKYNVKDKSEIESQAVELIIWRCGDIVYNYEYNEEIMRNCIYSKVFKSLRINLNSKETLLDIEKLDRSKKYNYIDSCEEDLDISEWNVDQKQEEILKLIYLYIEQGQDLTQAVKKIAVILNMEEEEILEELENIKDKLIKTGKREER